jgi:hypothetical protein
MWFVMVLQILQFRPLVSYSKDQLGLSLFTFNVRVFT